MKGLAVVQQKSVELWIQKSKKKIKIVGLQKKVIMLSKTNMLSQTSSIMLAPHVEEVSEENEEIVKK